MAGKTGTLICDEHNIPALMDVETATAIREAFGPSTGVYECNTPREMVAYAKLNTMSPTYFAEVSLGSESIAADNEDRWDEWTESRAKIEDRLRAIGINIDRVA